MSLSAYTFLNFLKKVYTNKSSGSVSSGFAYNAVCTLIAGIVILTWGGISGSSTFTIAMGAAFGVLTAVQGITNLLAVQTGPLSYTTVIVTFSTVISALSGYMFFGEDLTWSHIVGMILMLLSFVFATTKSKDEQKFNWRWLIYSLVAFLTTGMIGIMQKIHQSSAYKDQLNLFLIVAFVVSAILCGIFSILLMKKEKRELASKIEAEASSETYKSSRGLKILLLLIMIGSGICIAANNKLNLYLSGVVDSAVFFPLVNGGGLIMTTVMAFIVFREKFTKKQWCGLILGILSVFFLCNPF